MTMLPLYGVSVFLCQISVSKFMLNSIQFLVYSSFFNFQCAFSEKTCCICLVMVRSGLFLFAFSNTWFSNLF